MIRNAKEFNFEARLGRTKYGRLPACPSKSKYRLRIITMPSVVSLALEANGELSPALRNRLKMHFVGRKHHRRAIKKPRLVCNHEH